MNVLITLKKSLFYLLYSMFKVAVCDCSGSSSDRCSWPAYDLWPVHDDQTEGVKPIRVTGWHKLDSSPDKKNELRRNKLFQSLNTHVHIHSADTFMWVSDTQVEVDIEGDTCIHTCEYALTYNRNPLLYLMQLHSLSQQRVCIARVETL